MTKTMIRDNARSRRDGRHLSSRQRARLALPHCATLVGEGKIDADERVVIFNTGSGIKYLECYEE